MNVNVTLTDEEVRLIHASLQAHAEEGWFFGDGVADEDRATNVRDDCERIYASIVAKLRC